MYKGIWAVLVLMATSLQAVAQEYDLESPYGWVRAEISVGTNIAFRLRANGRYLVQSHSIALDIGKKMKLGQKEGEPVVERIDVSRKHSSTVPLRTAEVLNEYSGLKLRFPLKGFAIEFRAYDEGFAYRIVSERTDSFTVFTEDAGFDLMGEPEALLPRQKAFFSGHEFWYERVPSSRLGKALSSMPLTFLYQDGSAVSFTETDVYDYPSASLKGDGKGGFDLVFPKVPATTFKAYDRFVMPGFERNYMMATGKGERTFPWRIWMIGESQEMLMGNQLPWLLASEATSDFSWVRPGQCVWDWWHASSFGGVPFKTGLNTDTYRHYIDFAAANGIPYVIMDEGWYKLGDLTRVNPAMDVPGLIKYAESKGVKVILWVVWRTLQQQFDAAFDQFTAWGVGGIKMDFMMRSDQDMVRFQEKVVAEAAKRKMVVDLHGCHPPKGLHRKYPNVLSMEAVRGLEQDKWPKSLTPRHDCTLPLTRMLAGPMDYTPGSFHNQHQQQFRHRFKRPSSQGTRAHEVSKYVIFESPLQMLADDPMTYSADSACLRFINAVPTTWDTTVVLSVNTGHHVALARKKGNVWYLGVMGGDHAQRISVPTAFLGNGVFDMTTLADGAATVADAGRYDLKRGEVLTAGDILTVELQRGGGYAARISPIGR